MNQFNMNKPPIGMMPGMGKKTNTAFKFLIVMLLGILPLLLCALFIGAEGMESQFKQWGSSGAINTTVQIDYGFMWLIGLVLFIAIFPVIILLDKFVSDINLDVMPITSAAGLAMLNLWVIPHSHAAFLILSLPAFAIIGYIIGMFVMIVIVIKNAQKQIDKLQKDPNFKKMMDQMQKGGPTGFPNPNTMNQNKNVNSKPGKKQDYKDNPFVDIPEEQDEEEK